MEDFLLCVAAWSCATGYTRKDFDKWNKAENVNGLAFSREGTWCHMLLFFQRHPWQLTLLGFLAIASVHMLLGVLLCETLPHSRYRRFCHDAGLKHDLRASEIRSKDAVDYLENIVNDTQKREHLAAELRRRFEQNHAEFCVAIVSVRRPSLSDESQYILPLLRQLLPEVLQVEDISLIIVNGEEKQEEHTALHRYARFVPSYHVPAFTVQAAAAAAAVAAGVQNMLDQPYLKEKYDYGHALRQAARHSPKYVVLLQDDVLPRHGFFKDLSYLVRSKLGLFHASDNPWAYVRLYYPERWSGFQNKDLPLLLLGSLAFGVVLTISTKRMFSLERMYQRRNLPFLASMFVLISSLVLSLLYMFNRYHIENVRLLSRSLLTISSPADPCCIPAVLYPRQVTREIGDHLISSAINATVVMERPEVDLAIADFAAKRNWLTYHSLPNLVTHHGRQSTLPKMIMEDVTWRGTGFERNIPWASAMNVNYDVETLEMCDPDLFSVHWLVLI